ncbi:MAG: FtsX-like permease family protein [Candidatus Kaiserbacteria bacterium]|nr:FtsX-like permease family protein [Candidatus Kaiserbacteria bacterium]
MAIQRNDFSVGSFLTLRYIRGANRWTTALIVFVMVLTFLNLTVIGGLLEGIVVGSFVGLRDRAIGDVFISAKEGESSVGRTQYILRDLRGDARIVSFSPRYSTRVEVITEDDVYMVTNANEQRKSVTATALGIDPEAEQRTTNLPASLLEGSYFSPSGSRREILIGSALLERYSPFGADVLSGVHPGDFVFLRMGGVGGSGFGYDTDDDRLSNNALSGGRSAVSETTLQKYRVRGVYRTKAGELDLAIIMHDDEVRANNPIPGNNANSIAIRLSDPDSAVLVRDDLLSSFGRYAKIETVDDAIGPFLGDIRTVFKMLGSVVGAIGLAVASVTIFIIIFVTAVSRSRFIGILKAIGITPHAIRISYVLYALSFAVVGSLVGASILYFVLVPFFAANPIPFPFSDGILYITPTGVALQIALLFVATFVAGLIPAHRVVRRPAIEAIRG